MTITEQARAAVEEIFDKAGVTKFMRHAHGEQRVAQLFHEATTIITKHVHPPSVTEAKLDQVQREWDANRCEELQVGEGEWMELQNSWESKDKREVWNQAVVDCADRIRSRDSDAAWESFCEHLSLSPRHSITEAIAEVKRLRDEWDSVRADKTYPEAYRKTMLHYTEAANEIITALETLQGKAGVSEQDERVYQAELAQERLQTAVQLALQGLDERCHENAALRWFQSEYCEAVEKVRNADEATVFALRKGLPTLTGRTATTPASVEAPPESED